MRHFELGDAFGGHFAVLDELGVGEDIFGEELALGDFDAEGFFELEADVEVVDGFSAEVFGKACGWGDFVVIDGKRGGEDVFDFEKDFVVGHGHVGLASKRVQGFKGSRVHGSGAPSP